MMGHCTAAVLSALFLLLSAIPWAAATELPAGTQAGPAGPAETSPGGKVELPITVAEEARLYWRRDLDRLKWTLSQVQMSPEPPPPSPASERNGEKLELTLERSIEIALENNLGIRIAGLSRDAVQTGIAVARATFHPTAGLSVTASSERTDPETGVTEEGNTQTVTPFIATRLPTGGLVTLSSDLSREETQETTSMTEFTSDLTLSVVQPLFRGGRIYVATRPIRDAEFDLRIEEAKLRAEVLRVTAATKSAYYRLALAERVIEVTEAAIQRDKALTEASEALFQAGLVTKRDILSAEISHAKDLATLISAKGDLESAQNALAEVLGLRIGTEVVLLDKGIGFQPVSLELARWIAAALRNRPEVLELDERLKKSALNVRVARNTLLPQVDLVASYGRSGTGSTFERSVNFRDDVWSAGILFSIPLGNAAARAELARAEIEHARLGEELSQRKREIELEVRAAVIKLRRSVERMKALTVVLDQAKEKQEVAKARFALGLATNLDITDAQEDILDADTDLLNAIVDYNIGLAELEASVGGPM